LNPPDVRGHDVILRFVHSIKLADDELRIRESLYVVGPNSVAELYPRNEGFILGLVVRCFEHELKGVLILHTGGALNDKAGSTAVVIFRKYTVVVVILEGVDP